MPADYLLLHLLRTKASCGASAPTKAPLPSTGSQLRRVNTHFTTEFLLGIGIL